LHTAIKAVTQILFLCLLSLFSNVIVQFFHLPLPGSIIGIFILFLLLETKIIPIKWIELGANLLLAELLLFFIPSAVGIIKYESLLESDGLRLLLVIVLGTVIVMASTGLAAKVILYTRSKAFRHDTF
jgi:holin-like protein